VLGLTTIFAGAVIPIAVMGGILEVAKLTCTVWLHSYWHRAGRLIKSYLTAAVILLACLTSIGVFGLLSRAHSDQGLVSGDVIAQVAVYDERIKTQRENIEVAKRAIAQMDSQVDARLRGANVDNSAERSVIIRRQQAPERAKLQREIADAQTAIAKLNEERAPIAAKLRKVEAEVGPIKYLAAMVYGDNPDANTLERAVRWLIIMIVCVFDPLAITLILAANNSLKWDRERQQAVIEQPAETVVETVSEPRIEPSTIIEPEPVVEPVVEPPSIIETVALITPESPSEPSHRTSEYSQGSYTISYVMPDPQPMPVVQIEPESEPIVQEPVAQPEPVIEPVVEEQPIEAVIEPVQLAEIETDGVTQRVLKYHPSERYVTHEGKRISIDALRTAKPELVLGVNDPMNEILFGIEFPKFARSGDIYTRIDTMPHRTFKFNGTKWMQADRATNTVYLQNTAYVQHLIGKLSSGEYDPELLTTTEQEFIEEYLRTDK
jgi:hypothetical protein